MNKPAISKVEIEWSRGLSEEWDGWHYRLINKDGTGYLSGPYKSLLEALDDIKEHLSGPLHRTLVEVDDE